ncbi:hypothetical protein GW17_00021098 [Ensete ventricosum]|nr:hypothetical protein GW17_00021098 [Ensete ventricosum]
MRITSTATSATCQPKDPVNSHLDNPSASTRQPKGPVGSHLGNPLAYRGPRRSLRESYWRTTTSPNETLGTDESVALRRVVHTAQPKAQHPLNISVLSPSVPQV